MFALISTIIVALSGFHVCYSAVISPNITFYFDDLEECSGPIYYYKELGCTPVYDNSSSECPVRYNCDIWKNLPSDKCLSHGKFYDSGESLNFIKDRNSETSCICRGKSLGWDCTDRPIKSNCPDYVPYFHDDAEGGEYCYQKNTPFQKCPGPIVCIALDEHVPTCRVDGIAYEDGEFFEPSTEPEKYCYCGEGYTGENVEPFCAVRGPKQCSNVLNAVDNIINNCAPVYLLKDSLQTNCNDFTVCQMEGDYVFDPMSFEDEQPEMLCKFGNLSMHINEELHVQLDFPCVRCTCEVPPVPTCVLLPNCETHDGFLVLKLKERSKILHGKNQFVPATNWFIDEDYVYIKKKGAIVNDSESTSRQADSSTSSLNTVIHNFKSYYNTINRTMSSVTDVKSNASQEDSLTTSLNNLNDEQTNYDITKSTTETVTDTTESTVQ